MRINFLRMYLYMRLLCKGNPWALLCVQSNHGMQIYCSQRCPKAQQQGKGCSQPLPQTLGFHSFPTWGPWVQERREIPEDLWGLGFAPSPPTLFSFWQPIKGQTSWQRQKKNSWPRDNLALCNISWRKLLCYNFVSTKWIHHNYCIQCESQWKQ